MPSTPLTDAIVALTTYANTVTGESDTTLSAAVETLVDGFGGGGVNTAFEVTDYKVPVQKWASQNSIYNYVAVGGCIHIKATIPSDIAVDSEVLSFGVDANDNWSPNTNCACYWYFYSDTKSSLRFRGSSVNGTIILDTLTDQNNEFEIKLYQDRFLDVKTNTTYLFSSDAAYTPVQTAMNNLCNYTYITVGCNQGSNRASGKIVSYFAVEAS